MLCSLFVYSPTRGLLHYAGSPTGRLACSPARRPTDRPTHPLARLPPSLDHGRTVTVDQDVRWRHQVPKIGGRQVGGQRQCIPSDSDCEHQSGVDDHARYERHTTTHATSGMPHGVYAAARGAESVESTEREARDICVTNQKLELFSSFFSVEVHVPYRTPT